MKKGMSCRRLNGDNPLKGRHKDAGSWCSAKLLVLCLLDEDAGTSTHRVGQLSTSPSVLRLAPLYEYT